MKTLYYHPLSHENPLLSPTCEDCCNERDVLVKGDGRIERDVTMQKRLPKHGEDIAAHCDQQAGIRKHHSAGRTPGYRDAVICDLTKPSMLPFHRIVWE